MAVDLTFYNKKHQNDIDFYTKKHQNVIDFASKKVQEFLEGYQEETCCAQCEVYQNYTLSVSDMPRHKYQDMHNLMGALFFSSGFWSKFEMTKYKNDYKVTLWLQVMTPEEKEKALFIPDPKNHMSMD